MNDWRLITAFVLWLALSAIAGAISGDMDDERKAQARSRDERG